MVHVKLLYSEADNILLSTPSVPVTDQLIQKCLFSCGVIAVCRQINK